MSDFKFFQCLDCGYSGSVSETEIAKHRSRCSTGPTAPLKYQIPDDLKALYGFALKGDYRICCFDTYVGEYRPSTIPVTLQGLIERIASLEVENQTLKPEIDEFKRNQPFTEALIHDLNQEITRRDMAESQLPPDGLFRFEDD